MCVLYTFSKARVVLATTLIYAFCMHNAQASRVYRTTAVPMLRKSSSSWKVYKRNWQKAKQPHLQTFHEKEIEGEAGEEMHDERKQSCLSKGLPYQKCVFTSRTRQQRQQRIFDFTPLLTRSGFFIQKFTRVITIWVAFYADLYWSLSRSKAAVDEGHYYPA